MKENNPDYANIGAFMRDNNTTHKFYEQSAKNSQELIIQDSC